MPKTYATSHRGETIEVEVQAPASPQGTRGAAMPPPPQPQSAPASSSYSGATRVPPMPAPEETPELRAAREGAFAGTKSFFHPYSGGAVMGVDLAAWGTVEMPTGFLMVPIASAGAFLLTFALVFNIQRNLNFDSVGAAILKALIGATLAAVPFPIAGTGIGAMILLASGLPVSGAIGTAANMLTGKSNKK